MRAVTGFMAVDGTIFEGAHAEEACRQYEADLVARRQHEAYLMARGALTKFFDDNRLYKDDFDVIAYFPEEVAASLTSDPEFITRTLWPLVMEDVKKELTGQ